MKFTKMHGTGNDYVYINCIEEQLDDPPALARRLSNRNFGVGSDGLICICPSDVADFRMDMYNADGSSGTMCGNGIRCVGKYVFDRRLTDKTELSIETLSGIKHLRLNVIDGLVESVCVDMGEPCFKPGCIPMSVDSREFIQRPISAAGREWTATALSVGNPHLVIFLVEDIDSLNLEKIGPEFENHPFFPQRVNTEFVNLHPDGSLKMRVWERGSGETLACGTGATAVMCAASACGLCGERATVRLRGGELEISWDKSKNRLYMTGPAVTVFDGELYE